MAKNKGKNHRGGPKMTIPLAVVAGFMPTVTGSIAAFQGGGVKALGEEVSRKLTGYNPVDGSWKWATARPGLGAIMTGFMVHYIAGRLGVNRTLGRMGIPLVRI